ncbi:MAG: hypothetical protein ACTSO3_08055 [Candidatus Heimdallarchaeaceae archaeon]
MFYKNFLKKNKNFLLSQIPQLIILLFILVLSLIVSYSNRDRLDFFATEFHENDITGNGIITQNEDFLQLENWATKLMENLNSSLDSWLGAIMFPITHLNYSREIDTFDVLTNVGVIASSFLPSFVGNEVYLYGEIFNNVEFSVGDIININTTIERDGSSFTNDLNLNITGYISKLPSFISQEVNNLNNFLFINPLLVEQYFEDFELYLIDLPIYYFFGINFTVDFKNSFTINSRLDNFISTSSEFLNNTYHKIGLSPPVIAWGVDTLQERLFVLIDLIIQDFIFYMVLTIPIMFLLVAIIYKLKDISFSFYSKFIMKLIEKGFTRRKISNFFICLFFALYTVMSIISLLSFVGILYLINTGSIYIILQFSIYILIWFLICFSFQYITFRSEFKKLFQEGQNSLDRKVRRSGFKVELIRFMFIFLPFILLAVTFYILHYVFSFPESTIILFSSIYVILGIIMFHPYIESVFRYLIYLSSYLLIIKVVSRKIRGTGYIIQRLLFTKSKTKVYEYTSLLIMFLLAPSIFIVSDSIHYHVEGLHYNSICGDISIDNVEPEVYNYIRNLTDSDQILPIIKWKTESNLTFIFSIPELYSNFVNYSWYKGQPYTERNETVLRDLDKLQNQFGKIIVSREISIVNSIRRGDHLTLHLDPQNALIISPENTTHIEYEVSSILDFIPYFSLKTTNWVFANINFDENISLIMNSFITEFDTVPVFNSSLINTLMLKSNNSTSSYALKDDLLQRYPYLSINILGDSELINENYPVPYQHFQNIIILEIVTSMLLLMLFFAQITFFMINQKKLPIFQLFSKGVPISYMVTGLVLNILTMFILFSSIGIPFAFLLAKGFLSLISFQIIGDSISLIMSPNSICTQITVYLFTFFCTILLSIIQFNRIFKRAGKYLGEQND